MRQCPAGALRWLAPHRHRPPSTTHTHTHTQLALCLERLPFCLPADSLTLLVMGSWKDTFEKPFLCFHYTRTFLHWRWSQHISKMTWLPRTQTGGVEGSHTSLPGLLSKAIQGVERPLETRSWGARPAEVVIPFSATQWGEVSPAVGDYATLVSSLPPNQSFGEEMARRWIFMYWWLFQD